MMKKINLILASFLGFALTAQPAQAMHYDDYLAAVEVAFDGADGNVVKQRAVIFVPVGLAHVAAFQKGDDVTKIAGEELGYHAHAMAFAIADGNVDLVRKFLGVIDDVKSEDDVESIVDVNAESIFCWGYRQPYSLAHIVLDPGNFWRRGVEIKSAESLNYLKNMYEIMDMLAEKGVDFNRSPEYNLYPYPPVQAGSNLRGWNDTFKLSLNIRAFLHGAEPYKTVGVISMPGSEDLPSGTLLLSHTTNQDLERRYKEILFDMYVEMRKAEIAVKPIKGVKEILQAERDRRVALPADLEI